MRDTMKPTPTDGFKTDTSDAQIETENIISALFKELDPEKTALNTKAHVQFAAKSIYQGFPKRYTASDASQPWLLFWNLQACQTMGVAFDPTVRKRAADTVLRMQHPNGGFGGGYGQNAHLLATYAAVCSLAIVGSDAEDGGWNKIDRKKMYSWFMSLKQPDASFLVSEHAEVDMRGIYCLLVVATMLDLITPELIHGLRAFVASCQTFEGGFSSSSQPYFTSSPPSLDNLLESPRPALGEAHGGYSYCALASLILLEPLDPYPDPTKWMGIDVRNLYRWAVNMQGLEIEGGGFRGRTNKLVDGCYSWWVGGLFPLLEDVMGASSSNASTATTVDPEDQWADDDTSLYNRQALQGFILVSSQTASGGLRDKPGKPSDGYHTLYNLSGLSSAQHHVHRPADARKALVSKWTSPPAQGLDGLDPSVPQEKRDELRREAFVASMVWMEEEGSSRIVGGKGNRVNATHPTFDLTMTASRTFLKHFYSQKD